MPMRFPVAKLLAFAIGRASARGAAQSPQIQSYGFYSESCSTWTAELSRRTDRESAGPDVVGARVRVRSIRDSCK